jgi:hypothetical protein
VDVIVVPSTVVDIRLDVDAVSIACWIAEISVQIKGRFEESFSISAAFGKLSNELDILITLL